MRYVLYVNLWGTLEKLRDAGADDVLFRRDDFNACQAHFAKVLDVLASASPSYEVSLASDTAYVTADALDTLVDFAAALFQAAVRPTGRPFALWPLRAAIAADDSPSSPEKSYVPVAKNLRSLAVWGAAPVEAANLEKSAQKGFRLFLTKECGATYCGSWPIRACETRGLEHYEIGWLASPKGRELGEHFRREAAELLERGGNYSRKLGASLDDLTDWCR